MEARSRPFTFVREVKNFIIPFFQRGYEWEEDRWSALLQTLMDQEFSHFLGSFIIKQAHSVTGDPQRVYLIDGQQRITTISILLKALYDLYPDRSNAKVRSDCDDIWFYRKFSTDTEKFVKITHSYLDRLYFEKIITTEYPTKEFFDSIKKDSAGMLRCYKYFHKELLKYTEQERTFLLNLILDSSRDIIIVIDVKETDDEQTIFRTINSEGSPLSVADIIKNDIFNRIKYIIARSNSSASEVESQLIKLYDENWKKTFLRDEQTDKFWRKKRATGRIQRDNLSILLHIYAVIKQFYPTYKASVDQLHRYYKSEQLDKLETLMDATNFLHAICSYAEQYRAYISGSSDESLHYVYDNTYDNTLLRISHILKILDISTLDPFVVYVMHDVDESDRVRYLSFLETYVMRRLLAQESTKNYNKEVNLFIQNIEYLMKESVVSDEQILFGMKHLKPKQATLVLFWIELYLRAQSAKFTVKRFPYNYSLEHIMPQKWRKHDWPFLHTEYTEEMRTERIHYLGNLTLLTQPLNSAISNNQYTIKMEGNSKDFGIIYYAGDLVINKESLVATYEAGVRTWSEQSIEKRSRYLYDIILKIW